MVPFLQNAIGFLIQLFPCAIIIFLPFPKEAYRFRRKSVFIWITLISLAAAVIFSAVLCLRDMSKYPKHIMISNSFMLAAVVLVLAAYIWLVRESVMKKILVFLIVMFYAVTNFVLVNVSYSVIFTYNEPDTTYYPYTERFLLLYAAAALLLLPLMLTVVMRPLKEYIRIIEPENMKREFFVVTVSTISNFIIMIYCDTVMGNVGLFNFLLLPMIFLMLNQILIYWLTFRESVQKNYDAEQRKYMEIQQLQYEKIANDIENTRRMLHDLRHHYNSLNDMLEQGLLDDMKKYLEDVIQTTYKRDSQIYCKNMTVNGLLQYYAGFARNEGIRCDVQAVCDEMTIDPPDLTVIFGNAMENAIRACGKYSEEPQISIKIGVVQGQLAIEITNSCKEVHLSSYYKSEDGFLPAEAFLSDHSGGGYGLRSISNTAQKYHGSVGFRFDEEKNIFISRIRLNMCRVKP